MRVARLVEPKSSLRADLQKALSTYIDGTDTSHDLAHADRVWLNAGEIARNEGRGNLRILIAAAYLHDLVSLPKDHVDRHKSSILSADKAAPVLQSLGYTADEITQVQHVIAAHSYSANIAPETIEAMILQDADRLDALGAIGIARTFAVSGALGLPIYDAADPFSKARQLDDRNFAIDHWPIKLLRLPALMSTDSGKALARQRVVLMKGFLTQLASELGTTLPPDWEEI